MFSLLVSSFLRYSSSSSAASLFSPLFPLFPLSMLLSLLPSSSHYFLISSSSLSQPLALALGKAYIDRVVVEKFTDVLSKSDTEVRPLLKPLLQLHALSKIEGKRPLSFSFLLLLLYSLMILFVLLFFVPLLLFCHSLPLTPCLPLALLTAVIADVGWFLTQGYFAPSKAAAIHDEILTLCRQIRPNVEFFVDALGTQGEGVKENWELTVLLSVGVPEHLVAAPIAGDWKQYYSYKSPTQPKL